MGNFVATNGQYGLAIDVRQNERLRLRLINAANARIFVVDIAGMEGWTIALDGCHWRNPRGLGEPPHSRPPASAPI